MKTNHELAAMFKALGDPTRLRIFEFLRAQCCPVAVEGETGDVRPVTGPTVGEVCCNVTGATTITSTVSFHLKELRQAGLITVERSGKNMICGVNQDAAARLAAFLNEPTPGTRPMCAVNELGGTITRGILAVQPPDQACCGPTA